MKLLAMCCPRTAAFALYAQAMTASLRGGMTNDLSDLNKSRRHLGVGFRFVQAVVVCLLAALPLKGDIYSFLRRQPSINSVFLLPLIFL